MDKMGTKVAIVTGATSGIGLETARGLAGEGFTVIMACRSMDKARPLATEIAAKSGSGSVFPMLLDLASLKSVKKFASEVSGRLNRLDVLVNNAGIFIDRLEKTEDGFEMTMAVNYLGPFLLTRLLLPLLLETEGARIINVTSRAGLFARIGESENLFSGSRFGFKAYSLSKLAQIHFTLALAEELKGKGITVNSAHPGRAATNIWQGSGLLLNSIAKLLKHTSPRVTEGAKTSLYLALSPDMAGRSGGFYHKDKALVYNRACLDGAARSSLIRASFEAVGSFASTC